MNGISFQLINSAGTEISETVLKAVVMAVCGNEAQAEACEVSLLICDDAEMRGYNRQYRGHDSETDVLSFSTLDRHSPDQDAKARTLLCDIIIDIKQLDRQKGIKPLEIELMQVFIHGLLHCFGYDHIRPQDRQIMTDKEQQYKQMLEGELYRG